jgi:hypothetical protein
MEVAFPQPVPYVGAARFNSSSSYARQVAWNLLALTRDMGEARKSITIFTMAGSRTASVVTR